MRWIARVTWYLLRAIASVMSAAALGCVASLAVSMVVAGSTPQWFKPISTMATMLAVAFGVGAIGGLVVMPPVAQVGRERAAGEPSGLPTLVAFTLVALVALAAEQIPHLVEWWRANHALAAELTPGKPDPMGWDLVIEVIVQAAPFLASLAIAAAVLAVTLAFTSPSSIVTRVLGASLLLELGLVGGVFAIGYASRDLSAAVQALVDSSNDALAQAQVSSWLGRYAASEGTAGWRLLWILGAIAVAWALSARWRYNRHRP